MVDGFLHALSELPLRKGIFYFPPSVAALENDLW
jgi:hypothetical protein